MLECTSDWEPKKIQGTDNPTFNLGPGQVTGKAASVKELEEILGNSLDARGASAGSRKPRGLHRVARLALWCYGFQGAGLRFMEKGFRSCTRLESTLSRCPSSNKDD